MPQTPTTETTVAITQEQIKNLAKQLDTVIATVNTLDAKLDGMQGKYMTVDQFNSWKDDDYQPHKREVAARFDKQDTRFAWLMGSIFTATLTLIVYLIVGIAGGTMHP